MSWLSFFIGYLVGFVVGVIAVSFGRAAADSERDGVIDSNRYLRELRRKSS